MDKSVVLKPSTKPNGKISWIAEFDDPAVGQEFWDTLILPDGRDIHDIIPKIDNIYDITPCGYPRQRPYVTRCIIVPIQPSS